MDEANATLLYGPISKALREAGHFCIERPPFGPLGHTRCRMFAMKVRNSLKSAKLRDKNCQIVKRKGRVYLINKKNPRFKARQG